MTEYVKGCEAMKVGALTGPVQLDDPRRALMQDVIGTMLTDVTGRRDSSG